MKWLKDAREGIVVAGGNGQGHNLNQLSYPTSLIANDFGQIYVADFENDRIMRWSEENKARTRRVDESDLVYTKSPKKIQKIPLTSDIIVGENGRENELYQLDGPNGLSFDCEGNLYVTD
ncbi:unnamed protein product [Adineta ricciae]|uniref:Uncharacterized protein n=1 Tax=Adineta ricciae TaxID=249248 RepID=A0A815VV67_ADIRI|nr:unnamed protein product [Adineta ricciae]